MDRVNALLYICVPLRTYVRIYVWSILWVPAKRTCTYERTFCTTAWLNYVYRVSRSTNHVSKEHRDSAMNDGSTIQALRTDFPFCFSIFTTVRVIVFVFRFAGWSAAHKQFHACIRVNETDVKKKTRKKTTKTTREKLKETSSVVAYYNETKLINVNLYTLRIVELVSSRLLSRNRSLVGVRNCYCD